MSSLQQFVHLKLRIEVVEATKVLELHSCRQGRTVQPLDEGVHILGAEVKMFQAYSSSIPAQRNPLPKVVLEKWEEFDAGQLEGIVKQLGVLAELLLANRSLVLTFTHIKQYEVAAQPP
jgi:hypothetical protein